MQMEMAREVTDVALAEIAKAGQVRDPEQTRERAGGETLAGHFGPGDTIPADARGSAFSFEKAAAQAG